MPPPSLNSDRYTYTLYRNDALKMLLPKLKLHVPTRNFLTSTADLLRRSVRPTEIHPYVSFFPPLLFRPLLEAPAKVRAIVDALSHRREQLHEIRSSKIRPRGQSGERIFPLAYGVEIDISRVIGVELLREISMDAKEFRTGAGVRSRVQGLLFEAGKQHLEPLEGFGVLADPDEFNALEAHGRIRSCAEVEDVLEDAGPGCDADPGAYQHGDLIVENVFCGRAVRAIDADGGHFLVWHESDFVHAHGVEGIVFFRLGGSSADSVTQSTCPIADLANMDRYVGVKRAGGDCERVPLGGADFRDVEKEPLAGLISHRWLGELNFQGIIRVANDSFYLTWSSRGPFAVYALAKVKSASKKFPPPTFVPKTVVPEWVTGERGVGKLRRAYEAACGMRVE